MPGIAINEIVGAMVEKKQENFARSTSSRDHEGNVELSNKINVKCEHSCGYNQGRDAQGQVRLILDREKLIDFLSKQKGWKRMHVLPEGAEMLADAIIAKLKSLITVVK